MNRGWVEALADTARKGTLDDEQHRVLAAWHDPEIRRAWASRTDTPQHVVAERIRVEGDADVLGALLAHLEEVDETTLDIAVRRGREAAYALVLSPNCPDDLSVRIVKHLRHSDRGWLERQLLDSTLEVLAGREATLELLYRTLDLDVFYRLMHHATSRTLQESVIKRLASLAPGAETTAAPYAKASRVPWEPVLQERYERLLGRQDDETRQAVAKARGIDTTSAEEREKAIRRAELRQALTRRAEDELDTVIGELETMVLESPADAKLAAEVASTLLDSPDLPIPAGARLLPLVGAQKVEAWIATQVIGKGTSTGELALVTCSVDRLRSTGYGNQHGRILEQLGKEDWTALRAALQTPGHSTSSRIRQAALDTARSSSQLRWLLGNGHTHERNVAAHASCDLDLLLDLKTATALNGRNGAAKLLGYILEQLPADRLETLDRLVGEWSGTTRALIETARDL